MNQIYINQSVSDLLGLEYQNENKATIVHSSALVKAYMKHYNTVPSEYSWLWEANKDLHIQGTGFGWWNVRESFIQTPN